MRVGAGLELRMRRLHKPLLMVSPLLADALQDPTRVLLELFDAYEAIDGFPNHLSRHFSGIFRSSDAFQEIPVLDASHPPEAYPERSIVSFRAMVQDTSHSPELYLARREDGSCGGWGLADDSPVDYDYSLLRECSVIWAVSVPGESHWCSGELDKNNVSSTFSHQPPQPYKFPLPNAPHIGVQIKLYENGVADSLKVTNVLNFIGILTSEPWLSELERTINVPTLHVLFSQKLPLTIVPRPYPATVNMSAVQEDLISWVAEEALGGDRGAAEWILLTCISRVQSRTPPILPPSLTVSHFPSPEIPSQTPTLHHVLKEILPLCAILPLSLSTLNQENFLPESKNEDLHSGLLQMPAYTSFLVTESGIQEGKLIEKGVVNVRAIQAALSSQTIDYVFPFARLSFPTDVTFIFLSEGRKSPFFQTSVNFPLNPIQTSDLYKSCDQIRLPPPDQLYLFRKLMGGAKCGTVEMGDALSERIQEDFVRERQENKSVTTDDLILWMTVTRLLALRMHDTAVRANHWERAKTLDKNRKAKDVLQGR